uniref:F-box domain-containing protein n=1 Tax=Caenorhabditis tropicalis TaxID=1561998 RepID=A0A1I7TAH0_9PELO
MNSKPLTYDSLKTVILYMEPSIRILLSSRIPSIRAVERRVPLRIKELAVGNHHIRVNGTSYSYEVYQVDCAENVPEKVSGKSKLNFKTTCDVDKFGIRDYIIREGGMVPGNNGTVEKNLFGEYDRENIPTNEGRIERLKKLLEVEKERYNQLLNYCPNSKLNQGYNSMFKFIRLRDTIGRLYKQEEMELLENEEMVKKAVKYTNEKIERMKKELLPFENRRNNIRPKFEIHVMKSRGISLPHLIERINYTKKLHKAGEYLIDAMFGKRRDVQTKLFRFSLGCAFQFPRGLKIKANELCFMGDGPLGLNLLGSIIDRSSFPLKKISIMKPFRNPREIDHELIGNCKSLELTGQTYVLLPRLPTIQNKRVHLFVTRFYLEEQTFITLIRSWIETNKPIGTCFTFSTRENKQYAIEVLQFVNNQIEESVLGLNCVIIPMGDFKEMKINYERDRYSFLNDVYLIKMTVVSF